MSQFTRTYLRPAGDALLLLVALAVANLLIGKSDPGWLHINPAPFLAVPVFVGARYGFSAGVTAGALAVATILGGRHYLLAESPSAVWENFTVTLAAFPVIGALSGELRRIYAARMRSLESVNSRSKTDRARLESEVDLLRESNRAIRLDAALHGAELAAIDIELRDILSSGDAGIFGNTLDFLRRSTGVEEAVLAFRTGSAWQVAASSLRGGVNKSDPAEIDPLGIDMAERACKSGQIVTWAALWKSENSSTKAKSLPSGAPKNNSKTDSPPCTWLAAVPWINPETGKAQAVLLVRALPLHRATWDNFARISTICRWVAGLALARVTDTGALSKAAPLTERTFKTILALAAETGTDHRLPSALLSLKAEPATSDQTVQATLSAVLRPTDIYAKATCAGTTRYAVLLPLSGQRDAADLLERLSGNHLGGNVIPVDGTIPADDLWRDLTEGKLTPQRLENQPRKPGTQITPRAEPV